MEQRAREVFDAICENINKFSKTPPTEELQFPLPPRNCYIVMSMSAVNKFKDKYHTETGLYRKEIFLEVCKYLFNLQLPPGRWYADPRNIEFKVERLKNKRQERGKKWKEIANVENPDLFFNVTQNSAPKHPTLPLEKGKRKRRRS
jgi:hypothetical protein